MSKKKKIIIGSSLGVAAIIIIALLMVFVFDTFGMFTSEYKLNYDKYVTIGKYKGLDYTKPKVIATKKEVKAEIQNFIKSKSTTKEVKGGIVKKGDTVSISYEGRINGKTFEGGSAKNTNITIGQTSMIDGFVDGLIGKKVGDKFTLHLRFPKNYANNKDLSGKKVDFAITIHSKQETTTPKYNLDFIKKNTQYKTVAAYEDSVKKSLLEKKQTQAESSAKKALWEKVVASSKVKKYPQQQLEFEQKQIVARYKKMAKNYNMSWAKFLKTYMNTDEKKFKKQSDEYAKTVVKQKLVTYAVAKKEGIKVSDKEFNDYLAKLLKQAGFTKESFKKQYKQSVEKYAEENGFRTNLLLEKVNEKVVKYAKVS